MKTLYSLLLVAAMLCCTTMSHAQSQLYEKYNKKDAVSAVYISKAMLEMQPQLAVMGQVNINKMAGKLDGVYILSTSNEDVQKEMKADVEKYVKQGKYEVLMEQKSAPGQTSQYYIKRKGKEEIKELILATERTANIKTSAKSSAGKTVIQSAQRTTTYKVIILTGAMTLQDIQSVTRGNVNILYTGQIPDININFDGEQLAKDIQERLKDYKLDAETQKRLEEKLSKISKKSMKQLKEDLQYLDSAMKQVIPNIYSLN